MFSPTTTPETRYLTWTTPLSDEEEKITRDISNPIQWPPIKKAWICGLSILTTLMAAYSISAYVAGVNLMAKEFRSTRTVALIGMTTFQAGFAIGPMALAPFSELNGRRPVFLSTYAIYNVCTLIIALIKNLPGLIAVRFLQGVGASTFSAMVGGIISDLYEPIDRGLPMAIFATASFSGGLGELVSSYILTRRSWRWIHWHQLIINSVLMLLIGLFFRESRGPVILSRKAKLLNLQARETSEEPTRLWKVIEDEERASISKMVRVSLTRPFYLLFHEPVVFWFSMWISFSWALMFLFFESVPLTFGKSYGFSQQQTGLVLLAMVIGALAGNAFYPVQESLFRRYQRVVPHFAAFSNARKESSEAQRSSTWNPEARLYTACFLSILLSIGMFIYGATNKPSIHWIIPALSVVIVTFGAYAIYLSVFNYFGDVYALYASSAMAAQSFCRNSLAGALPLTVHLMFTRLTFIGASCLLGGIGLLTSIVPWVLVIFGPKIRARSRFARKMISN